MPGDLRGDRAEPPSGVVDHDLRHVLATERLPIESVIDEQRRRASADGVRSELVTVEVVTTETCVERAAADLA